MFPQVVDKKTKTKHCRIQLNKLQLGDFGIFSICIAWMDMKLPWFESEEAEDDPLCLEIHS